MPRWDNKTIRCNRHSIKNINWRSEHEKSRLWFDDRIDEELEENEDSKYEEELVKEYEKHYGEVELDEEDDYEGEDSEEDDYYNDEDSAEI